MPTVREATFDIWRTSAEQLGIRVAVEVLDQGAVPRSAGKAVRVVDRC